MKNYLLKNCTLYDGCADSAMEPDSAVLVEDGRIKAVYKGNGDRAAAPEGVEEIDLGGRYVIPGLINLHAHLFADGQPSKGMGDMLGGGDAQKKIVDYIKSEEGAKAICGKITANVTAALYSGVTTVRGVGDFFYYDVKVRDMIDAGEIVGPRLVVSGPIVTVPGGHGDGTVGLTGHTLEELSQIVKANADHGVDLIKICITGGVADAKKKGEPGVMKMTYDQVKTVCDTAHELGYMVAAHCESTEGVRMALDCGVNTVEHGSFLDEGIIKDFKEKGSCLICTLSPALPLARLSPEVTQLNEFSQYNSNVLLEGMISGNRMARENGVKVGLGTDAGCPFVYHHAFWRELCYYQKYVGGSNLELLHKATLFNASLIGIDKETGSIEPGKAADLVVLSGNPAEELKALRYIDMVMARGNLITDPKLDRDEAVEDQMLEL